jgi:hypothetical protein
MRPFLLLLTAALASLAAPAGAQVSGCDICHGKPDFRRVLQSHRTQSLYVTQAQIDSSIHKGKRCTDCHVDVTEIPHRKAPQPVNCVQCHYEGNTVGAPQGDMYQEFRESVHGQALAAGKPDAPACQDCHGTHQVRSHKDPRSQAARANIASVCGKCHLEVYSQYRTSIHGVGLEQGKAEVPTCTGCHQEHGIRSHLDPQSSTYAANIAPTCANCHAAEGIVGKYGISSEQVGSYKESFHGVASRFGMATVANCASCHGVHDIRPPEDPNSSVNVANIPKTCGKCHAGANANYAVGKIHVAPRDPKSGIVYWVSSFFKWLTILTVCGLVAHIILDLARQVRSRRS